ncbi:MAG: bacillithiol biosynthesis cysteine-adding enzyme BshC [Acidobacteriota bacterium]
MTDQTISFRAISFQAISFQAISFREIPRTSRLFRDYVEDFGLVSRFYNPTGTSLAALVEHAGLIAREESPRAEVAAILRDQNVAAGATAATLANLERLGRPDSVAIVTGQQAGLFTGPLYTIFKALTAVKLARQLEAQGLNAVPVFWIAAEDHDFEEVNHSQVIDREGHLKRIVYTGSPTGEGRPVGSITINEAIESNLAELAASLPDSEFMHRLIGDLRETYQAGHGFAAAFASLLTRLIGHYGIGLIDPLDDRLKAVASPIYDRALARLPEFAANLVRRSTELETAGYHAQVHTGAEVIPLFILEGGRRTALILGDDGRVHLKGHKGAGTSFDYPELVSRVHREPTSFSPNVTLRPIVQDYLLPTAAIIGGAAEIAYFAQLHPNYELLGRKAPLILPRASLSLVEKRHAKTMDRFGLGFADLFDGHEAVLRKVVEGSLDHSTATVFDETETVINEQLERLRVLLQGVDPTLAEALKGGREKILYQIHNLRTRFVHNRGRRDEVTQHQVERMSTALYPHRNLQERELNICYFLARYGYEVIDQIYEAIGETIGAEHRLMQVG